VLVLLLEGLSQVIITIGASSVSWKNEEAKYNFQIFSRSRVSCYDNCN